MINLRMHPLICQYCQKRIPSKSGDFQNHRVSGFLGEKAYLICPNDSSKKQQDWVFEKNNQKNVDTQNGL